MAPVRARDPSIERSDEYEEFLKKLEVYHEARGTVLEKEPKIGPRHIDLLRLYKRVCEEGGYDRVSDTKGNKLAWRRLATEFLPGSANVTTQAFILKTAYYKNLAAYEITTYHKKEPPPKEILEDVSAKGGDLLNRTIENFDRPLNRETENLSNGVDKDSDNSDNEIQKTPGKEDKMDLDESGNTGGRTTRGLRQAPPQRVLFQPEVSSARQTRHISNMQSPAPGSLSGHISQNGYQGASNAASTIANYEPRQQVPSMVKPVATPANNPDYFKAMKNKLATAKLVSKGLQHHKGMMLPGTGFIGPNIYIRALLALQSRIPEEEAYALHHLVKISHERGDKYRFDGFPGLAEALMAKVLDVSTLFYDVNWEVSFADDSSLQSPHFLDGLNGTADLLRRIKLMASMDPGSENDILTERKIKTLGTANEAGLVLRNMVMLESNAEYLSRIPLTKDLITIVLHLPHHANIVELKHYALELAEQLTKFWILTSESHLYQTLLEHIDSTVRGTIITSLRAISRTSMNLETTNRLSGVPRKLLQRICDWLLVEDDELRNACLDFLYQFTALTDNVETLVHNVGIEGLARQLTRLLLHNAHIEDRKDKVRQPTNRQPLAETTPKLSAAIVEQLVQLEEPERSSQWLRTCFEEDPQGEITQITLWSAYNSAFNDVIASNVAYKSLMPAKDFITNVSTTFTGATAQVLQIGSTQKYTIKGIRPRSVPVDPVTRRPYMKCLWQVPAPRLAGTAAQPSSLLESGQVDCGEHAFQPVQMWEHILSAHLRLQRDDSGKWILDTKPSISTGPANGSVNGAFPTATAPRYDCKWGGCRRFAATKGDSSAFTVGMHIKTHLPDDSGKAGMRHRHNRNPSATESAVALAAIKPDQTRAPNPFERQHQPSQPTQPQQQLQLNQQQKQHPPLSSIRWMNTMIDDRADAAGIPLAAVLVLRNLARQMAKLEYPGGPPASVMGTPAPGFRYSSVEAEEEARDAVNWVSRVFAPLKDRLYYVMAHNYTLREYMASLTRAIAAAGG